jgi:pyruvate/2-oxoacid:ferredoxin oxidoreductase alpha subunit
MSRQVMMGTAAATRAASLARVQVVAAYPITPSSSIVEKLSELCATGALEARFVAVESEHSAMATLIGAAMTGARTFTATSSQGLALMHELLHWAASGRLPTVMANVNRALAPPWTIHCDQNDSIAQRDTGWLQFYCENNQEVLDTLIQAYRVSETVHLPSMVNMDAFLLSHTSEPVDLPTQEEVDAFLPPLEPLYRIRPEDPHSYGAGVSPAHYMEFRFKQHGAAERAAEVVRTVGAEFAERFGRGYDVVEEVALEEAEVVLVTSGTITSNARLAIEEMRGRGLPVGLLKMRLLRPFPAERIREVARRARKIAVIDRNLSPGVGGVFAQEARNALYGEPDAPPVWGFVAGLGGRDVLPEDLVAAAERVLEESEPAGLVCWLGLKE